MTKTLKDNVVAFSEFNAATGKYCIITVYGATPGTGSAQSDFKREWTNLVIKQMTTEDANPKTDSIEADGWTVISAGSSVDSGAGKAVAFLSVISGTGSTVSILAVFNDPAYVKQIDTFIATLDLDKPTMAANTPIASSATFDSSGRVIVPALTRQLTLSDLAGEWGEATGNISTAYVYRDSGASAGTDSWHFSSKWTFKASGTWTNDFFEVRNGKGNADVTGGPLTIEGRVIFLKRPRSTAKYLIRGWLDLPNMTILRVTGPWYDAQEIPARSFTDPDYGFSANWVRKK
ncbi:MAG: hypothetical protein ABI539_05925 [Acidobacteriota bacterium]